jgi:FkbM family methyltransferase
MIYRVGRNLLIAFGLLRFVRRLRTRVEIFLGRTYNVRVAIRVPTAFIGSYNGGYAICLNGIGKDSVVYSFGLGDDVSFDLGLIKRFGCHVYGADPTPKSLSYLSGINLPERFRCFPYAIAPYDGEIELFFPKDPNRVSLVSGDDGARDGSSQKFKCISVKSLMNSLGHQHVDIIKMDIKGPEFEIIPQLLREGISFNQLIVEFTPEIIPNGHKKVYEVLDLLEHHGYLVFNVSDDGRNISIVRTT